MSHAGQSREPSLDADKQARDAHDQAVVANFVAVDPKSQALLEQARKVAASASTVLIRGESGTGKDLLAWLLHYLGPNPDAPFVKIDCASLPHELMESELFGYERGAFTGASQTKPGRLELAGVGTLVLEEVAALTMPMQAKLLRVIEEKRFERLGGSETIRVDARIVALTSVDLERAMARHTFREDLYYRLNVIPLLVPPLRERRGDIAGLANHFMTQLCEVHRKPAMKLDTAAVAALEKYDFPGNIRELRNLLERSVVNGAGAQIRVADLPAHISSSVGPGGPMRSLEEVERDHIAEVLDFTRGRKSKAAKILGISRKTLLEKRKRYKLD